MLDLLHRASILVILQQFQIERVTSASECVQREANEKVHIREREEALWRFHPPPLGSLSSVHPGIIDRFGSGFPSWAIVWKFVGRKESCRPPYLLDESESCISRCQQWHFGKRARVLLQTGLDIHDNTLIYICNSLLVQPGSDKSKCYENVIFESLAWKLK